VTSPIPQVAAPADGAPRPLLEREAELAATAALVEAAGAGTGRLLAFEGRAGMGKSRLVAATREVAANAGFEVISARGGELEQDFAYGVVRQLFEPLLARSPSRERAKLLAGAAGLAKPLFESSQVGAAPTGTSDMSFPILHGLYWLVANIAARRPTLLTIDDLHWCDPPTLRWLGYLSRRLEGLPLLVTVSLRPAGEGHEAALLTELVSDPAATVVHPGGLGLGSIAALARDALAAEPDHEFCAACRDATDGNPLFVGALLDTLAREAIAPRAEEAKRVTELGPEAMSHAISLRLLRLSADATALVRAAAILGDGAALGQAGMLAHLEATAAAEAAQELVRADLLRTDGPLEFTHPVLRTSVYETMGAGSRIAAHKRAAVLVLEAGSLPEQAAAHLMLTEPAGDEFVVTTLSQAAGRAIAEGAPDAAAAYLSRALAEPPADQRGTVLSGLGTAEMHIDERAAVEHLRLAIESTDDVEQRAEQRALDYGQALIYLGRQSEAVELYSSTLDQLGRRRPDLRRLLEGELNLAAWCEPNLCQLAAERLAAVREDELESDLGSTALLAALALSELRSGASRERAVALAGRVVQDDLAAPAAYLAIDYAILTLTAAGEVDAAEQASERALVSAQSRGDRLSVNDLLVMRAFVHAQRGNLQQVESDLAAIEDGPLTVVMSSYASGLLADVLVDRGTPDEAAAATSSVDFTQIPLGHRLLFIYGRARARQANGATEQALADFLQLGQHMQTLGVRNPAFVPWRSQAALALHALGRTVEASELGEEELELARLWGASRAIGMSLRAFGLVQGGRAGQQLLADAVATLADSPARLEHARALIDLGAALRRGNNRSNARALLRDGIDLAQRCGASALVARANDELAATGAHRRTVLLSGLDALTASERRVAHMAAQGLTNKEIAQALFVTVKTVEVHLSRVYRKLDVSSRRDLSVTLGPPDGAAVGG